MNFFKILIFSVMVIVSFTTNAREVRVTSIADSGTGTFREAIDNALSYDTIIVDVKGVINILSQINFVTDNLLIQGPYPKHNTFTANSGTLFNFTNANNIKLVGLGFKNSNLNRVISLDGSTNIAFESCLFENNTCSGAGMFFSSLSSFNVLNCSFSQNHSDSEGGAMYISSGIAGSPSKIVNSTFWGNTADAHGGAIVFNNNLEIDLINNLFYDNSTLGVGEAIEADFSAVTVNFYNNVFSNNGNSGEKQVETAFGSVLNFVGGNVYYENDIGNDAPASYIGSNQLNPVNPIGLKATIVEDGYGLKYFTIVDQTSALVDAGLNNGNLPLTDTRRAPRTLTGDSGFITDAGPCEYTKYSVTAVSGVGSLEAVMLDVNTTGSDPQNYIEFDIVGYDYSIAINLNASLNVNKTVYIDGYSQNTTSIAGPGLNGVNGVTPAANLVQVSTINAVGTGIIINSADIMISGLNIHGFDNFGINTVAGDLNPKIFGNHIGFIGNAPGSYTVSENKYAGIGVAANNANIGGNQHWQRNVISGNGQTGSTTFNSNIYLYNTIKNCNIIGNFIGVQPDGNSSFSTGSVAQNGVHCWAENVQGNNIKIGNPFFGGRNIISGNKTNGIYFSEMGVDNAIDNNFIGLGYDGSTVLTNGNNGVSLTSNLNQVTIGSGLGNVISGNTSTGINIQNCQNTLIIKNIIGLDVSGMIAKPNVNGVTVSGSSDGTVIGVDTTSSNIISGNSTNGIWLNNGIGTLIQGNEIGTNIDGTSGIGNQQNGILCEFATGTVIGGSQLRRNIISDNGNGTLYAGIVLKENGTTLINSNYIGTDKTGLIAFGNYNGIIVWNTHDAYIGGAAPSYNLISGNQDIGIRISSELCTVEGNIIGLNRDMNAPLANSGNGIEINADNVIIGATEINIISGNGANGVYLNNVNSCDIDRCMIGTNPSFDAGLGNGASGIQFSGGSDHGIGLNSGNTIVGHSNSGFAGISIDGTMGTWIQNNYIGLAPTGVLIPNQNGIQLLNGANLNVIGNNLATNRNVISGNDAAGVSIDGASTANNSILGNLIGLSIDGATAAPNNVGIQIVNGANNNEIGEDGSILKRNIISANTTAGIYIDGASTADNVIYKNYIGSDSANTTGASNNFGIWVKNCSASNYIGDDTDVRNSPVVSGNYVGIVIENSSNQYIFNTKVGARNTGLLALPNVHGIVVQSGSNNNVIGGDGLKGNMISGNDSIGIAINSCNNNTINGNRIGTNINGTLPMGNLIGIYLSGGSGNLIGTSVLEANHISSNSAVGIVIDDNAIGTFIKYNFIGTNNGATNIYLGSGNGTGILVKNTNQPNVIGGTVNEGNYFANNQVSIGLDNASNQEIKGNVIGINAAGTSYIGGSNSNIGIYLNDCSDNTIGNSSAGSENAISNQNIGIYIDNSTSNAILKNYIGNDLYGTSILGGSISQITGISIDSASTNNVIGAGNVISGNDIGIKILNTGTSNNQVKNNFIGVNSGGNVLLPNNKGVEISNGASGNIIGGLYSSDRNVISGCNNVALNIMDIGTSNNIVSGNIIGLGIDEITLVGNNNSGITIINGASNNIIGGAALDSANYICDNGLAGVLIGVGANNNFVRGNKIGIKPDNSTSSGNLASGIIIDGGNSNIIGGLFPAFANEIANNISDGVEVKNNGTNNQILGNSIYENGDLAIDINSDGVTINNSTGIQNNVQIPTILQAFECNSGGYVDVGIELKGLLSGQEYIIEFFDNSSVPDPSGYGEADVYIMRFNYTALNVVDTAVFNIGNVASSSQISVSLTAINGNGGTSEMSQNFAITNQPSAPILTLTNETCQGSNDGAININDLANSQIYYYGLNGDVPQFNTTFDTTILVLPGMYTVSYKYLNGCQVTSGSQVINFGGTPVFTTVTGNDTCDLGGSIMIDASLNIVGTLGASSYIDVTNATVSSSPNIAGLIPGDYDVALQTTLFGATCLSDTLTITILAVDLAATGDLDFDFDDFCATVGIGSITNDPIFTNGTFSLSVNPSGATINSITGEISGTITQGSQYTVDYSYGTCLVQRTPTAIDVTDPSFTFPDYCLATQSVITPVNSGGTFALNPVPTDGASINPSTGEIILPVGGNTYTVEYNTGGGCPGIVTEDVTVFALPVPPIIMADDSVICNNEAIPSIYITGTEPVDWYVDQDLPAVESGSYSHVPNSLSIGDNYFYGKVSNANGCWSNFGSINIFRPDLSGLTASDDVEICLGSEVEISALNGVSYVWEVGDEIEDNTLESIYVSPITDTYYYVTIYDQYNCESLDSVKVSILDPSLCNIDIYTAFSPNDDGDNDVWIIDGIEGYKENNVYFYNRWGDLVYDIENYDNDQNVWDGTNKFTGTIVAPGTYFYVVESGGINARNGWVQVVR